MDRLRKAHRAVAAVLVPLAVGYYVYVFQHPSAGGVSRGEAALRATIAVGAVAWVVLWSNYVRDQNRARREAVFVGQARVLREATVPLPVLAQPAPEVAIPTQPSGLDPKVLEIGRRIARGLHAPDVRQED